MYISTPIRFSAKSASTESDVLTKSKPEHEAMVCAVWCISSRDDKGALIGVLQSSLSAAMWLMIDRNADVVMCSGRMSVGKKVSFPGCAVGQLSAGRVACGGGECVLDFGTSGIRCRDGSGRCKSSWQVLKMAEEAVVLIDVRTLSLSGYLMVDWKVARTLLGCPNTVLGSICRTAEIVRPSLNLWSSRRHPF